MQIINFYGNPNIGLFFYSTNKFTIVPKTTTEQTVKIVEDELKTTVIKLDVFNSSVNAIFLSGNDELLLIPRKVSKDVISELEKLKMKLEVINTDFNALGNNIVIHKKKALVNPNFEEAAVKQLEKLGFEVLKCKIAGVETVGANLVIFKNKGLINEKVKDDEFNLISEFFGIEIERGTVNNYSSIVKAGFCKNDAGILVSSEMNGSEIMALEALMK